jgi:hypothetical protein
VPGMRCGGLGTPTLQSSTGREVFDVSEARAVVTEPRVAEVVCGRVASTRGGVPRGRGPAWGGQALRGGEGFVLVPGAVLVVGPRRGRDARLVRGGYVPRDCPEPPGRPHSGLVADRALGGPHPARELRAVPEFFEPGHEQKGPPGWVIPWGV